MKILYAGSSQSSSLILQSLISSSNEVIGVITKPDKRSKRDSIKEPSYVAKLAEKNNVVVFKPENLDQNFKKIITKHSYDILLVVAYGKLLPEWLIKSSLKETVNIHYSLLPKYRGASPIQSTILNNDKKTGISVMKMTSGLDEGPVFVYHELKVSAPDNKNKLEQKLTSLCIKNIHKDLENICEGKLIPKEQDAENISYCKKISKLSGKIIFDEERSENIFSKFKAYSGWPGLYFERKDLKIKIHGIADNNNKDYHLIPNKFYFTKKLLIAKTMNGSIVITHLQFPGKNVITSEDAANSYADFFRD